MAMKKVIIIILKDTMSNFRCINCLCYKKSRLSGDHVELAPVCGSVGVWRCVCVTVLS